MLKNRVSEAVERAVLRIAAQYPTYGQLRAGDVNADREETSSARETIGTSTHTSRTPPQ